MKGWHVFALWLAAALASALLLNRYLSVVHATATTRSGGMRGAGVPFWLLAVLLVVFLALLVATWSWWHGRVV